MHSEVFTIYWLFEVLSFFCRACADILLDEGCNIAKLTDFGISRILNSSVCSHNLVTSWVGTVNMIMYILCLGIVLVCVCGFLERWIERCRQKRCSSLQ